MNTTACVPRGGTDELYFVGLMLNSYGEVWGRAGLGRVEERVACLRDVVGDRLLVGGSPAEC